ncbi:MAG: class I SAM-dependent methyltransferase, partial [Bdellovibrionales bacterium]|nr:class I SAM-dependent methyltransferase [Bdellovibrionales bacterium]
MKEIIRKQILSCLGENQKEFRRIFFGRGRNLPFNIDRLDFRTILITCFEEIDINSFLFLDFPNIIIQNRYTKPCEIFTLKGELKDSYIVQENGISFKVYLDGNQNIGLFPEMRLLKNFLKEESKGKKVLNMFSYTCSFSVYCALGGAREIHNIDMMKSALERGRENHRLNLIDLKNIYFHKHNIKKSWGLLKRKGPFDLIIFDPPSAQGKSFTAQSDYQNMLSRLPQLLTREGRAIICLNSPHISYNQLQVWASNSLYDMSFERRIDVG